MGTAAGSTGAKQKSDPFAVDEDAALAELERAWAAGGYHAFTAEEGIWAAVTSAGEVLTGGTPDALASVIRAHWQEMQ